MTLSNLPTLNAGLNLLATIFLLLGFRAIKMGEKEVHQKWMGLALLVSFLFLISYLTYHLGGHGITRYEKEGILRFLYFTILITHTPLAAVVPFAAVIAVFHALKGNFEKHKKITRWLFPVWLYVSITGVLIYLMLYIL